MVSNNALFGGTREHWPNRTRWSREDNLQRWFFVAIYRTSLKSSCEFFYVFGQHSLTFADIMVDSIHSRQHMAVMRERSASMGSVAAILESARPRKGLPQFHYLSLPGDHFDKIDCTPIEVLNLHRGEENGREVALFTCTWTPGFIFSLGFSFSSVTFSFPVAYILKWQLREAIIQEKR